jgi:hypothetical protein
MSEPPALAMRHGLVSHARERRGRAQPGLAGSST